MPIKHTFKVKKHKKAPEATFTVDLPGNTGETDLVAMRYGTLDRLTDRANGQWTVDVAPGIRKRLEEDGKGGYTAASLKLAADYADGYCDNGKKDTFKPTLTKAKIKELGLTKEQIAGIMAAGMQVEK